MFINYMACHVQQYFCNIDIRLLSMIKIHDTAKVSENCDIEDSVRGSVIEIGAFSNIDSFVKIKPAGIR